MQQSRAGGGEGCSHRLRDALSIIPVLTILTLAFSLCIGMAGAPDSDGDDGDAIVVGDLTYEITGTSKVSVAKCNESATTVTIPETVEHEESTYTVVSIGNGAFKGCSNLRDLTFSTSSSFTSIGDDAFYGCERLETITLPASVDSIGVGAFSSCTSLASIFVESGGTYSSDDHGFLYTDDGATLVQHPVMKSTQEAYSIPEAVTAIGTCAFDSCKFTEIIIHANVGTIGVGAFRNCASLTTITVNESNQNYSSSDGVLFNKTGNILFQYPAGKEPGARECSLSDDIDSIADYAFYGCTKLDKVTCKVSSVGKEAFKGCTQLSEVSNSNGGMTAVAEGTFEGCVKLTSPELGRDLQYIRDRAFKGCSELEYRVPDLSKVTQIGDEAFSGCEKLYSVGSMGSELTEIGAGAFEGCRNLFSVEIPSEVQTIGENAFKGCTGLRSITLGYHGSGSGYIGNGAFYGCTMLSSVTFREVSDIETLGTLDAKDGQGVFQGCSSLSNLSMSGRDEPTFGTIGAYAFYGTLIGKADFKGAEEIGAYAFGNCTSLTEVVLGSDITSLDGTAFDGCTNGKIKMTIDCAISANEFESKGYLGEVIVGTNGSTSIPTGAFKGCANLKAVTIGPRVSDVVKDAFEGCGGTGGIEMTFYRSVDDEMFSSMGNLKKVTVDGTYTIGKNAFSGCENLTDAVLKSWNIGNGAFYNCTSLANVTLTNTTKIGDDGAEGDHGVFEGCTSLNSITLPDSVGTLGYKVFAGSGLTAIVIPDGVGSVPDYAFDKCMSLSNVTLGERIGSVGMDAFISCPIETMTFRCNVTGEMLICVSPSLSKVIIEDSVTSIGSYALARSNIETVIFSSSSALSGNGSGLTIGEYAFAGTGITEVTIPSRTTSIEVGAFYNDSKLAKLTFGQGIGLTDLPGPESEDGHGVFEGCGLATIENFPSVKSIGARTFYGTSMGSFVIPDSVESIGSMAFADCNSLKSIKFGTGVNTISGDAFGKMSNGELVNTKFYKSDQTSLLDLSGLDDFRGWSFTGDINTMYREESYAIAFDPDNGTDAWTEDHRPGEAIVKPADPEKAGNTFQYWMDENGTEFVFDKMPARNVKLTASWELAMLTVTYVTGTGTDPTETCQYGVTITLPDGKSGSIIITRPGYVISGWQIAGEGDVYKPGTEYTVTSDTSFVALWEPVMLTVTYVTETGTDPTQTCQYGVTIALPDGKSGSIVITRSGYTLVEWQGADGTVYLPGAEYTVTSDVTFTAVWKASPSPGGDDDDDPYVPDAAPETRGGSDAETGASVAAVAIAAGCAAALLVLLAMLGRAGSKD